MVEPAEEDIPRRLMGSAGHLRGGYLARLFLSLVLGALGGLTFWWLRLPLPWMLGAMCALIIAAMAGMPVASARRIRPPFAAVLGVTLGSSFQAGMFNDIAGWLAVTAAMAVSTAAAGGLGFLYFYRVARFDKVTAYFAGMPAGVYEMTIQGGLAGGDERRIAITQAVRIFLIVLCVPFVFNLVLHFGSTSGLSLHPRPAPWTVRDAAILLGCGVGGWFIARCLRLPNAPLLGPMLLSAVAHASGVTEAFPPALLVSGAQVILGASIGGQFLGADRKLFSGAILHGIAVLPLMLLIAVLLASGVAMATGMEFATIFLALAPGGTVEMSLVALAIHAEVALVVFHQLARIILIHAFAPSVFRKFVRGPAG